MNRLMLCLALGACGQAPVHDLQQAPDNILPCEGSVPRMVKSGCRGSEHAALTDCYLNLTAMTSCCIYADGSQTGEACGH